MKYLRRFASHSEYEAASLTTPCVVYDGSEVHYLTEQTDAEDEELTDKTDVITDYHINEELD